MRSATHLSIINIMCYEHTYIAYSTVCFFVILNYLYLVRNTYRGVFIAENFDPRQYVYFRTTQSNWGNPNPTSQKRVFGNIPGSQNGHLAFCSKFDSRNVPKEMPGMTLKQNRECSTGTRQSICSRFGCNREVTDARIGHFSGIKYYIKVIPILSRF